MNHEHSVAALESVWWVSVQSCLCLQSSTYPCEKLKSLTVTIGASLLTEDQDPKVLLMMFKDQVFRRHFGEVKKLAKARGIVLKLDTPVRIKEYPIVQLD